nr:MAG TPA: hypothetical protein [Caudoviricetes sp.]
MARKLTAEQQAEIAKIEAQQAADAARYGEHVKLSADMRSEFLNMAWAKEARGAAFKQAAEAWGIGEDGILRLPADREAMAPVVAEAYNRMWEIFGLIHADDPSRLTLDQQTEALRGAFHEAIWLKAGGRRHELDAARQASQTNE